MRFYLLLLAIAALTCAFDAQDYEIFRLKDALRQHESANTTFYDFLGVEPSASFDQINKAYRRRSRQWHPDKNRRVKFANQRFARLGTVVEILRSPRRDRYDHFLRHGFPRWRGTGYYYSRFRPGLGSVLIALYLVSGLVHYVILGLNAREDRKRMQRYITEVRLASGVVGKGQKRKVKASDDKVFMVDEDQSVFLVDQEDQEWFLDVNEIEDAKWQNTLFFRFPVSIWRMTLGRSSGNHMQTGHIQARQLKSAEGEEAESDRETANEDRTDGAERMLANGRKIASASSGPAGRRRKTKR